MAQAAWSRTPWRRVRTARWWREHRPAARLLFDHELAAALEQIRTQPESGLTYPGIAGKDYRRLLVPRAPASTSTTASPPTESARSQSGAPSASEGRVSAELKRQMEGDASVDAS